VKIADLTGLIVLGIAVLLLLGYLAYRGVARRAGINRSELKRIKEDRRILRQALTEIDRAATKYRDIDSPLATEVRTIVENTREKRDDL
jgi:hypothetical protein